MSTPHLVSDFASTVHRFHADHVHFRAFPRAAYAHPETIRDLRQTTPEYLVEEKDGKTFICTVEMRPDPDLERDRVDFLVPSFILNKMVGCTMPPVLFTKPEYANCGPKPEEDE
jgi:hypothetical protein